MTSLIVGKRSTYQEPIEEEVGSTSCGGTDRSGLARMVWDGVGWKEMYRVLWQQGDAIG